MSDPTMPGGAKEPLSEPDNELLGDEIDLEDGSMEGPDIETSATDSMGSEE